MIRYIHKVHTTQQMLVAMECGRFDALARVRR